LSPAEDRSLVDLEHFGDLLRREEDWHGGGVTHGQSAWTRTRPARSPDFRDGCFAMFGPNRAGAYPPMPAMLATTEAPALLVQSRGGELAP
jgi:hypothetical protein